MQKRIFKIIKVEAGSWSTDFSIKDMEHSNQNNAMSPEAFFHHIGGLCGKSLDRIQGLTFEVILPGDGVKKSDDPLDMCDQVIKKSPHP